MKENLKNTPDLPVYQYQLQFKVEENILELDGSSAKNITFDKQSYEINY